MSVRAELTPDAALPALARALDVDFMRPLLARAVHGSADAAPPLDWSAEVLNHKLGRRCTIRYLPFGPAGSDTSARPVIGKLYGQTRRASRVYGWLQALRSGVAGDGALGDIPAPLALLPDLGLVLQEHVDGVDLRYVFPTGDCERALPMAARWLAAMHAVPALDELKVTSPAHELRRAERWCGEVCPCLPDAAQRRLSRAVETLRRAAGEMGGYSQCMIHRDFYYAQLLWDGTRVWVLDFDQLTVGDPALDVAHFVAHLAKLSYRTSGRPDRLAEPARLFVRSYRERSPVDIEPRLPFYKACTFLKLAAKEANRKRGNWQGAVSALTDLACQEAEGAYEK